MINVRGIFAIPDMRVIGVIKDVKAIGIIVIINLEVNKFIILMTRFFNLYNYNFPFWQAIH